MSAHDAPPNAKSAEKTTLLGFVTDMWKGGLKKYALITRYDANC